MPRLATGDPAPDFTLPTAAGSPVSLAALLAEPGRKGVVVYFYPAAMTPGCTKQACDFRDSLASLASAGYAVVGVSPDGQDKLAKFAKRDGLTFPLASDADHAVADAYGAWDKKSLYGRLFTGLVRSTIVVEPVGESAHDGGAGRVVLAQYAVKATGHVARLRTALGIA
jgi:peroxiredoxin Q/BCP